MTLVTGASGCTGMALREMLSKDTIFLSSRDGDLTKYEEVRNLFDKHRPDIVIHLASNVGRPQSSAERNCELFEENTLMNLNIIKACREYDVKRLINISSVIIFSGVEKEEITTKDIFSSIPKCHKFGYAASKMGSVIHSYLSNIQFPNLRIITLIPSNIYGPYDIISEDGHLIGSLISRIKDATTNINVYLHPSSERQFLFNYDLAKICVKATTEEMDPFMIVAPPPTRIDTVCEIIARYYNYKGEISYLGKEEKRKVYQGAEIEYEDIEKGLQITMEWYDQTSASNSAILRK